MPFASIDTVPHRQSLSLSVAVFTVWRYQGQFFLTYLQLIIIIDNNSAWLVGLLGPTGHLMPPWHLLIFHASVAP